MEATMVSMVYPLRRRLLRLLPPLLLRRRRLRLRLIRSRMLSRPLRQQQLQLQLTIRNS